MVLMIVLSYLGLASSADQGYLQSLGHHPLNDELEMAYPAAVSVLQLVKLVLST